MPLNEIRRRAIIPRRCSWYQSRRILDVVEVSSGPPVPDEGQETLPQEGNQRDHPTQIGVVLFEAGTERTLGS